ncbi:hypothetical protein ET445_12630 [Agromyces protaetiae]|uniref:Uncharacterized protein n=1 Tax=Agromyces protaetiae TaxID=2509455 RepID=A0A4P6FJ99_9MICO|nr:hypothetical protein [Agromyces protaetiae]QAY74057.1 hypothetical protein ET445_12630 [Agromyces protaetiae]
MARDAAGRPDDGNAFTHFFDRVDRALSPVFESPPGPQNEGPQQPPSADAACPVCGHPMFEHRFDNDAGNVILICPTADRLPERNESTPFNELGMPADERRLEKIRERELHAK